MPHTQKHQAGKQTSKANEREAIEIDDESQVIFGFASGSLHVG